MKASADGFKDEDWSTALAYVARTRGPGVEPAHSPSST
jgi:hypothetical protein